MDGCGGRKRGVNGVGIGNGTCQEMAFLIHHFFFLLKCRQFHVLRLVLIKKIKINGTFYDRLCVHKRSLNRKPRDQVTSAMPLRSQEHPVREISSLDPDSFMS